MARFEISIPRTIIIVDVDVYKEELELRIMRDPCSIYALAGPWTVREIKQRPNIRRSPKKRVTP